MKILNVEQGSVEWLDARKGIPTASRYGEIITPKTMAFSKSAATYRNQLLCEWLTGFPIDWSGQSAWMDRGTELEPQARAFYELKHDVEVQEVGFMVRDDGQTGGSPDGLVGEDGGVEIKCPAMHTHIGYLLEPTKLVAEYRTQTQGYLYLSGRKWWDVMSFNPSMPEVVCRIERDESFIAALDNALAAFLADLEAAKEKLAAHRAEPALV